MEEEQVQGLGSAGERVIGEAVARLRGWVGVANTAMFTTADELGALKSRPMIVREIDEDGQAWLVSDEATAKVHAVRRDARVNLAWTHPVRGRWVSASGRAAVIHDRARVRALWDTTLQRWFPEGPDDPRLCLLRVRLDEAATWEAPRGGIGPVTRLAKHLLGVRIRDEGRETLVLRARQPGVGDTAGVLGTAGGSLGTAPPTGRARSQTGATRETARANRATAESTTGRPRRGRGAGGAPATKEAPSRETSTRKTPTRSAPAKAAPKSEAAPPRSGRGSAKAAAERDTKAAAERDTKADTETDAKA